PPGTQNVGGGGFVRGIGTSAFGFSAQASVGLVLDGVVMGNTNITSLFDLNRVEVLKGPQGTLFGNSVSAGVINIVTNAPDPAGKSFSLGGEWGADDLGSKYSRYMVHAVANLPLTETSAIRIALHSEGNDGVFRDVWTGRDSTNPDNGVRVRYLARPADNLTINLIADYSKMTSRDVPDIVYRIAVPGSGLYNALTACGVTASPDNFDFCSEHSNTNQAITRGFSAQLDWGIGDNTLTSISSLRGRATASAGDIMTIPVSISQSEMAAFSRCAPPPGPPPWPTGFDINCVGVYAILPGYGAGLQTHDKRQFSEELRLASGQNKHLEWVAGLFFLDYKEDVSEPGLINGFFTGGFDSPTGKFAEVKTRDYAAFGNLTWYFTDRWRAIAGVRYTHSKVEETAYDIVNHPAVQTVSTSASKLSYRAGLQADIAAHAMTYLTLATGYKAPQINDSFANGHVMFPVKPEVPTSVELGIKASAFGNRLAVDAAVFYTEVKNYQGQTCTPISSGIDCVPTNVPKLKSKGVEVDIFGRPIEGLSLNLTGIYNPAEYPDGYLADNLQDLGGTQLTHSSKTKVTLSTEYQHPISGNFDFVIGGDATYRSELSRYPRPGSRYIVPATWLTNARLGLKARDDWAVYLFGRNLGNEHFPRVLFPPLFQNNALWQGFDAASLRIVGLQLEARF
ncbi:MAG: TonB-dependent receptor, partial [Gammaproteobacteria bacterium]|nr:TonB-dependent receptor [Gammaproteobacteria bacterium]